MQWGGEAANKLANTAISIAKRMSHFEESHPDAFECVEASRDFVLGLGN